MAKRREIWYTGTEHRRHVYRIGEAYEKTACLDWRDSAGAAACGVSDCTELDSGEAPRGVDRVRPAGAGGRLAERGSCFRWRGRIQRRDGFVVHDRNAGKNAVQGRRLPRAGERAVPADKNRKSEYVLLGYCFLSCGILGQQPGLPHNHHKRQHFRRGDQNRPHAGGATVCIYC